MARYHIMNSDIMENCAGGLRPSKTTVGQIIVLRKAVETCSWKTALGGAKEIPAGKYKIVSRKGFVGGSQEIESVAA